MWCCACQQDVPALGSPSGGDLRCGKCGTSLAAAAYVVASAAGAPSPIAELTSEPETGPATQPVVAMECIHSAEDATLQHSAHKPPLPEDDWALEAELRGVQRLLSSLKARPLAGNEPHAIHTSHPALPRAHVEVANAGARESGASNDDSKERYVAAATIEDPAPRGHSVAWLVLSVSLAVFSCGSVLLVWSLVGQRADLWPVGLPLALIGQAGLMVGVVLQLDGLRIAATVRSSAAGSRKTTRRRRRAATAEA
jgi:hypothetical protein